MGAKCSCDVGHKQDASERHYHSPCRRVFPGPFVAMTAPEPHLGDALQRVVADCEWVESAVGDAVQVLGGGEMGTGLHLR